METVSFQCIGDRVETRIATGSTAREPMRITVPAETEAYYSQLYEEEFAASLQRLADKAQMVRRDDGTTGFTFG